MWHVFKTRVSLAPVPVQIASHIAPKAETIYHSDLYRESLLNPASQERKGVINPNCRTMVTSTETERVRSERGLRIRNYFFT